MKRYNPIVDLITINIDDVHPSQFYVDKGKIEIISSFIDK